MSLFVSKRMRKWISHYVLWMEWKWHKFQGILFSLLWVLISSIQISFAVIPPSTLSPFLFWVEMIWIHLIIKICFSRCRYWWSWLRKQQRWKDVGCLRLSWVEMLKVATSYMTRSGRILSTSCTITPAIVSSHVRLHILIITHFNHYTKEKSVCNWSVIFEYWVLVS